MTTKDILKIYHSIGLSTNVRDAFVKEIVESQYKFTREKINELILEKEITKEEFKELKTNFTFKYLGKLYTNHKLINYLIRKKNGRKFKRKGTEESN